MPRARAFAFKLSEVERPPPAAASRSPADADADAGRGASCRCTCTSAASQSSIASSSSRVRHHRKGTTSTTTTTTTTTTTGTDSRATAATSTCTSSPDCDGDVAAEADCPLHSSPRCPSLLAKAASRAQAILDRQISLEEGADSGVRECSYSASADMHVFEALRSAGDSDAPAHSPRGSSSFRSPSSSAHGAFSYLFAVPHFCLCARPYCLCLVKRGPYGYPLGPSKSEPACDCGHYPGVRPPPRTSVCSSCVEDPRAVAAPGSQDQFVLGEIESTPKFLQSPYIYSGYRVHFTIPLCLSSLFKLHNETVCALHRTNVEWLALGE